MLTLKQKEFCKLFVTGKSGTESYRISFKSKNKGNCSVGATRLLKSKEIKDFIAELQTQNKKIVDKAKDKAVDNVLADGSIADATERMQRLTSIMRGEAKIKASKFFFDSKTGSVVTQDVEELPDHAAQIRAIDSLNKMTGDIAPTHTVNKNVNQNIELTEKEAKLLNKKLDDEC